MTLTLSNPAGATPTGGEDELKPRITVFGVGGAGGNAVNNMIEKALDGVDFVVANTDAQALTQSLSGNRVQLGVMATQGLGAGAKAEVGAKAAEESIDDIVDRLAGAHMCFITAGMGGGTGTGAAPIIAQAARELGVLTVGVVTKPFLFEGAKRMRQAESGVEQLQKVVDTLIVIPNQNLFRLANEKTTFTEAFSLADDVLYQGVKGVTDLMVRPGLINLDFADVRSVMDEMGKAMMGTGEAEGEDRAVQAAQKAIANPLLDEISLKGARGVLINITGGGDLTLFELDEAANCIRNEVDADANIIVGSTLDDTMQGAMRVSVVATGIDAAEGTGHIEPPMARRTQQNRAAPAPAQAPAQVAAPIVQQQAPQPVAQAPVQQPVQAPAPQPAAQVHAPVQQPAPTQAAPVQQPVHAPVQPNTGEALPSPVYNAAPTPAPQPEVRQAPGTPTPDAMDRLAAAVQRAREETGQPHQQAAPASAPAPQPEAQSEAKKPRMGMTEIFGRMGGRAEPAAQPAPAKPALHAQKRVLVQDPQQDAQQDSIEIPAFLRRQAN